MTATDNLSITPLDIFDLTRDRWVSGTHITWQEDDFYLEASYLDNYLGCPNWSYWFYHQDQLVFDGSDFKPSPILDDAWAVTHLLRFLAIQPGEVDAELFSNYTSPQLLWAKEWAYDLSILVYDLEFAIQESEGLEYQHLPITSLGDTSCTFNAQSELLQCAMNPFGNCQDCRDYTSK